MHFRLRKRAIPPLTTFRAPTSTWPRSRAATHKSHCPYKGDANYFGIGVDGKSAANAVWTYEAPYAAVAEIKDHLAFYPDRVDAIEEG